MAAKRDAAADLAEKLLWALEAQRALGNDRYPLTVQHLAELAEPQASPAQIARALGKKRFQQQVVLVRRKLAQTPIALAADLDTFAGHRMVLEFLLESLHTPSNQAFSVAQLKDKAAGKLQKAFQAAINRQIADGSLSSRVGWLTINRSKKLFLLADVQKGNAVAASPIRAPVPPPSAPDQPTRPADGLAGFEAVFGQLDRQVGGHNFVSLLDLRRAWPVSREVFDAELRRLRLAGRFGLSAAEGRHGISPEERDAAIVEDGTLLLYVSRKAP
jgi:hypothetical protein